MEAWLTSLLPWGISIIKWVQSFHNPVFDVFFKAITIVGDELGYIVLLPLFYWCIDAQKGRRIGVLIFFSLGLNSLLKSVFHIPRPGADQIRQVIKESGLSFPSGHAQGSATLWGHIFALWQQMWFRVLSVFLILSIGLSRVYLGVHYPQDIMGGWFLGLTSVILFVLLEPKITPHLERLPTVGILAIAIILPLGFFLLSLHHHHVAPCACLMGFSIGIILERQYLRFSSDGTTRERALRYLAIIPVGLLLFGLKAIFPSGQFWRFLRYVLTSFSAAFLAPWLFLQLKWAVSENAPSQ